MTTQRLALGALADSILYLASVMADQPRSIDRYIDYFGGDAPARGQRASRLDA